MTSLIYQTRREQTERASHTPMIYPTRREQTERVPHTSTELTDAWQHAFRTTMDLNVQLAQQGLRATALLPFIGYQLMQAMLGASLQLTQGGMQVWQRTLPQASLPQMKKPVVTVGPHTSFYFRGPEDRLNLPADNLARFIQLANQVDDRTWQYHLRKGDYTHWFRTVVKDEILAAAAAQLEHTDVSVGESRARIQELIEQRYTIQA
jgi:hypothetical protein